MKKFDARLARMLAAVAVVALSFVVLWLWAVPAVVLSSTFAVVAVFIVGGTAVTLLTWRNAQATSTIAQVLYEAEAGQRDSRAR